MTVIRLLYVYIINTISVIVYKNFTCKTYFPVLTIIENAGQVDDCLILKAPTQEIIFQINIHDDSNPLSSTFWYKLIPPSISKSFWSILGFSHNIFRLTSSLTIWGHKLFLYPLISITFKFFFSLHNSLVPGNR